ncbi:MAG: hypothetical protein V1777_01165 [Candidatus Micrarchaeota archaeon]
MPTQSERPNKPEKSEAQKRRQEKARGTMLKNIDARHYFEKRFRALPESQRIRIWNEMTAFEKALREKYQILFPLTIQQTIQHLPTKSKERERESKKEHKRRFKELRALSRLTVQKHILFEFLPPGFRRQVEQEQVRQLAKELAEAEQRLQQRENSRDKRHRTSE